MARLDSRPVYVVDDDRMFLKSLVFYLSTRGYTAQPYASGSDFLAAAPLRVPGCVVLDMRMPAMDGLQVLAKMADLREQLPVVFMTGHGDIASAVAAMREGAFDFLEKPCEEARLVEAIEAAFAQLDQDKTAAEERRRSREAADLLTQREQEVLHALAQGQSNKIIAEALGLSVRTIEMHRSSMMHRLGVRTLSDALRIYHMAHRPEPAPKPDRTASDAAPPGPPGPAPGATPR
jgi:two-component system response regulator FixJ